MARSPLPPREGISAARLRAPGGHGSHSRSHQPVPQSVGAWLRGDFPDATDEEILDLTVTGEMTSDDGDRVTLSDPVVPGGFYWFHRNFPSEERLPVEIGIVHEDEHLLVIDKPHFLASTPNGRYIRECVVTRLRVEWDEPDLVAIHRLDRVTAGLLLVSRRRDTRGAYQTLFQNRRIRKTYRALAKLPPAAEVPAGWAACRTTRLYKEPGERQVVEVPGPANAQTEALLLRELDLSTSRVGEFELSPLTGRTHQLRVHMNGWGMPILGDTVYPVDQKTESLDMSSPLQLLASRLEFRDPLTGRGRVFDSNLTLAPTPQQLG